MNNIELRIAGFTVSMIARLFPLQKKIVFDNYYGRGYGDFPGYIADYILSRKVPIRIIWMIKDDGKANLPNGIEPVKYNSVKALWHTATARVWIDNVRGGLKYVLKRKGQFYIQTWHAVFGVKKLGTDNGMRSMRDVIGERHEGSKIDLMFANSDYRVKKFSTAFYLREGCVIKCGSPRVAYLMRSDEKLKDSIYDLIGIKVNSHIIMYGPTFRSGKDATVYQFDYHRLVQEIEDATGKDYTLLIRLHPSIASKYQDSLSYDEKVINASNYTDMSSLLKVTDILITDYSSTMFDFSIIQRPVFIYAPDYSDYIAHERELLFDYKELPFPFSENEYDLIANIIHFDKKDYDLKCSQFYDRIGLVDNGDGDRTIGEIAISKAL